MFKKKLSGFTLVELLVAMAIISVLIGLAIGAITLANRSSRDSQRRAAIFEVSAAINEYYGRVGAYPPRGSSGQTNTLRIEGNTIMVGSNTVRLSGPTLPAADTDANGTEYCYGVTAGGYVLGVRLEGDTSTWYTDQSLDQVTDAQAYCSSTGELT